MLPLLLAIVASSSSPAFGANLGASAKADRACSELATQCAPPRLSQLEACASSKNRQRAESCLGAAGDPSCPRPACASSPMRQLLNEGFTFASAAGHCRRMVAVSLAGTGTGIADPECLPSAAANNGFQEGKFPYAAGRIAAQGPLSADGQFVRFFDNKVSRALGSWMMAPAQAAGLESAGLQERFALPQTPTCRVEVRVPAGTLMRVGVAGPISGWGAGGGLQAQLYGPRIGVENFRNHRPLGPTATDCGP